jgi:hypothetical protein
MAVIRGLAVSPNLGSDLGCWAVEVAFDDHDYACAANCRVVKVCDHDADTTWRVLASVGFTRRN